MGVKSLKDERLGAVLPHVSGRLLDIGCGEGNELVTRYDGQGVGADVYPWEGVDVLCDTRRTPFRDSSFDTVTMMAVLNHVPDRQAVLRECARVLGPGGKIVLTMISPLVGIVRHKLAPWDRDQHDRRMASGEEYGLRPSRVIKLLETAGFRLLLHRRFVLGLNHLFVGVRG